MNKKLCINLSKKALGPYLESVQTELPPHLELFIPERSEEIEPVADSIEIMVGSLPLSLLPRMRSLRWYQTWGAGVEQVVRLPEVREMEFVLTNASGVHARPIAEHVFGFILSFARGFHIAFRAQTRGEWKRLGRHEVFELPGKVLLVIGLGAIGTEIAEMGNLLGMRVLGIKRNPRPRAGLEEVAGPDSLLKLLPRADFVVSTAPLTSETKYQMDRRAFEAMKRDSFFINIGRGGTCRERDLIDALRAATIAGAGLDVFEKEPLSPESPLWEMENVLITSHYSGITPEYERRGMEIFLKNLRRYKKDEKLINQVDKKIGY